MYTCLAYHKSLVLFLISNADSSVLQEITVCFYWKFHQKTAAEQLCCDSLPFNHELWAVCKIPRRRKFCPSCIGSQGLKSLRPWSSPDPSPGVLPLALAGGSAPDPRYRLAVRTRHGLPPPPPNCWLRPCSSVTKLWTLYFENEWTDFKAYWHKWSRARAWTVDLGVRRSRSRSQEAEVMSGAWTGADIVDPLSRVDRGKK